VNGRLNRAGFWPAEGFAAWSQNYCLRRLLLDSLEFAMSDCRGLVSVYQTQAIESLSNITNKEGITNRECKKCWYPGEISDPRPDREWIPGANQTDRILVVRKSTGPLARLPQASHPRKPPRAWGIITVNVIIFFSLTPGIHILSRETSHSASTDVPVASCQQTSHLTSRGVPWPSQAARRIPSSSASSAELS
jgi:hypothetical protein